MPNFSCHCGHTTHLHRLPNPNVKHLVTDYNFDAIISRMVQALDGNSSTEQRKRELFQAVVAWQNEFVVYVVECSNCGNLYFFANRDSDVPTAVYKKAGA
jgi:hypothetical protein